MTERQEQIAVIKQLKLRCAKDATWFAVPNGIFSTPIAKKNAKHEGLRNGVPDMVFVKAGKPLFIELKKGDTQWNSGYNTVSDDQVHMHREITNAGGRVAICFGQDEAIKQLEEWGVLEGKS